MKYKYSRSSRSKLSGVHPKLVEFAYKLADIIDCKIVYGVRTQEEQYRLFRDGRSNFDGVSKKSSHQIKEDGYGHALDILPLPVGVNMYDGTDRENELRWAQFDGLCHAVAHNMGIKIKTGFKWRTNMMDSLKRNYDENTLKDGNHIELIL